MTVKELRYILDNLPDDYSVCFLCPDGFEDDIECDFSVEMDRVVFMSYCHRSRRSLSTNSEL